MDDSTVNKIKTLQLDRLITNQLGRIITNHIGLGEIGRDTRAHAQVHDVGLRAFGAQAVLVALFLCLR